MRVLFASLDHKKQDQLQVNGSMLLIQVHIRKHFDWKSVGKVLQGVATLHILMMKFTYFKFTGRILFIFDG